MLKKTYKAIIVVGFLSINTAFSQEKLYDILPLADNKVSYSDVIVVDNINRDELLRRAKKWIVDSYKSANDVIQYEDIGEGEIIGKGHFETTWQATFMHTYKVNVLHTVKIQAKDGRYRYEITNLKVKFHIPADRLGPGTDVEEPVEEFNKKREKNVVKFASNIDSGVKSIIESLNSSIKKPSKNDW